LDELDAPLVTSMLSIEMPAMIALDVEPEGACAFEALPVWFAAAVVLDGVVSGSELDVEPVPVAPVLAAPVLAVLVSPEGAEVPAVWPPNA
jgi:hypothetical protein